MITAQPLNNSSAIRIYAVTDSSALLCKGRGNGGCEDFNESTLGQPIEDELTANEPALSERVFSIVTISTTFLWN